MFNTRLSVSTFIQHNTAEHDILTNFRIRYNPSEGNDFYIMYNEGRNTSLTREEPNLPVYSSRSLMMTQPRSRAAKNRTRTIITISAIMILFSTDFRNEKNMVLSLWSLVCSGLDESHYNPYFSIL